MVRKTKEEAQQTATALLDAAERIFCEKGVARTTLNDIAAGAGMTRGAIYWHYKDKNDLFEAMCDRGFLPMQCMFNEIEATPDMDPMQALRRMVMQTLETATSNLNQRNVFDIIFHHCEKNDETATFIHERKKRGECLHLFQVVVEEAVKRGQLPQNTDTWVTVQAINSFWIGLIYEWLMDTEAYDLARHAPSLVDMFFAGLLARPPLKLVGDACKPV